MDEFSKGWAKVLSNWKNIVSINLYVQVTHFRLMIIIVTYIIYLLSLHYFPQPIYPQLLGTPSINMPVIFVHGVNIREGVDYSKNVATRNELIKRLILEPLGDKDDRFKQIEIVNPYWGDLGVKFSWDQATLPKIGEPASALELFEGQSLTTPNADIGFVEMIDDLDASPSALENDGSSRFKRAAEKDLPAFIEALLLPIIFSEVTLTNTTQDNAEKVGVGEALLIVAAQKVGEDDEVKAKVTAATSDDEIVDLLKIAILARFDDLAAESELVKPSPLEINFDWVPSFKDKAGEFLNRTTNAPARLASIPVLKTFRETLHQNIANFVGDGFVYLNERGDENNNPGPIVLKVLEAIRDAPRHHDQEPTIIITHSMGGNILYDILTYYAPNLSIDVWILVGGQVGLFEEMKIFQTSDKALGTPQKLSGLESQVSYWLNVYDVTDIFSFKVDPVFQDVDEDLVFNTGTSPVKSHGGYFKRPSFYRAIQRRIEEALIAS